MNNKVCVYTICKNEEKNIDKWIESVKDADCICLIDTGSTDKTLSKIMGYYNEDKIHVWNEFILDPFSFSEARNYAFQTAYEFIMKDTDDLDEIENWVFVSLDLDEFIEPGGINLIRESWNYNNYDTIELGVKSIVFDENGNSYIESESFVHHKIHSWRFKWVRDVHEIIKLNDGTLESDWRIKHIDTYYEHIQDKMKPRNYYEMLKLSYAKGDMSIKTLIYLAWEAYNHNDFEDMRVYAIVGIIHCLEEKNDENYLDYQYIICFRRYLSMYYSMKEDYIEAYNNLKECINIFAENKFPKTRLIYREIARVSWHIDKMKSIMYYHAFNEIYCPNQYWVEDFKLYETEEIAINYMELSNAYYYCSSDSEFKKNAAIYAKKAYELYPEHETIKANYKFFETAFKM